MNQARHIVAMAVLAAAGLLVSGVQAADVTGTATLKGEGEASKDACIKLALRDACEKHCGLFLQGQKTVPNRDKIFNQVMTRSSGFVSDYTVKRADFFEGAWSVVVAADIACEKFADTWKLTYCQVNSPRLMVVVTEKRDGADQSMRSVQGAIEQALRKKGFRLVDKEHFEKVKESRLKEAALADDLASAASVARDFGAELLVAGEAKCDKADVQDIGGMKFQYYTAEAVVKVVQGDSAALVVSRRASARGGALSANAAAGKVMDQLGKQIAAKIWKGCVANWDKMIAGNFRTELRVSGVSAKAVVTIERELKKLKGVTEVNLRSMRAGAAHFDIVSSFSAMDLFKLIAESKALAALDITGTTQNVIQARWKKESI